MEISVYEITILLREEQINFIPPSIFHINCPHEIINNIILDISHIIKF